MASSPEFVRFVCEQLAGAGRIRCKRMFGEYGLWCDGVFFATIEDGMLCLKITDAGRALLPGAEIVEPHEGARFLYVAELDDRDFLATLVQAHLRGAHGVEAPRREKISRRAETGCTTASAAVSGGGRPLSLDASTGGRPKDKKAREYHMELTHLDETGAARMVDVGDKQMTRRMAQAQAVIIMQPETLQAILDGSHAQG